MTPLNALTLGVFIGCMGGLVIGWFAWRLPMVFAEQRGQELDADGLTICSKVVADAGREAIDAAAKTNPL